jgi:hypothetical protein
MACDDLRWLRPKIGHADIFVLASPLYFNGLTGPAGVTGSMKQLMDRIVPGSDSGPDLPYPHAVHVTREQVNLRKVVIVSGCGFLEIDDFYPVLTHLKALCYNSFPELAGCITGPVRATVRGVLPEGASEHEIADTAQEAGREFVRDYHSPPPVPLNVRTKAPWNRREWNGEVLYQF